MFFNGLDPVVRTLFVGTITYFLLITLLRVTGKRTLSKLNIFDFIVTIALGSTVATILLAKEVSLVEGISALVLLTLLQLIITWLSQKSAFIRRIIKAEPSIVFYKGQYQTNVMSKTRITKSEILQAMRRQGIGSTKDVHAVVLETNGELSVITHSTENQLSTIEHHVFSSMK
jgi:uncharacterized membrane protein YcaP (DUF421 family)